ncbi:LysR family transcriptional regulator [Polynucleobacter sp. MG-5-Ahmo-C2]|jgi:LysR family malonate utilization transcriptional regulator|uniref:LysR substrate-binding domain-containing protein n=1 Tax=unclassified Polynucleobacter TaxID=2640945 RepID=UPI001BFD5219|nr:MULTISPECIES: LysR substrate-binding domain-containing protein [unclassified Polynucleobacter]QWD71927.1 LysR family transcriptional regulator [Polynucleobacter sp. UB-Raua-W9]QWD98009.1 LysR family transcriptional regulator [Polynucleobacter sp. MG-5-Ahmo-C2]
MLNEEVTLRKLEILCSFVRTGSLVKTAEELHLSSVSIHKALHSLETGIGCPLFIKEGRQLKTLPAAIYLAEASLDLLSDMDRILKKTRSKSGVETGQIRLGSMYSLTANIIPRIIMGTKIRRPDLDIDLYLGSNEDLMTKLSEGSVDAVVIAVPSINLPDGVQVVPLFEDDLFLASSKKSKPTEASVDLSQYRDEKFLTLQDGFATTSGFYDAFQLAGFKPNVTMKVGDIFSLMNMVSGDLGRSLLPGRVKALMGNSIEFTPLLPKYRVIQRIGLLYLQANESNPNILALAAEARMLHRNKE